MVVVKGLRLKDPRVGHDLNITNTREVFLTVSQKETRKPPDRRTGLETQRKAVIRRRTVRVVDSEIRG